MAYLKPQKVTCRGCGVSGTLTWVIGVGPHSEDGKPAYRNLHRTGIFIRNPSRHSQIICPDCKAEILDLDRTKKEGKPE